MEHRKLGRFDIEMSIVGFGGIVAAGRPQADVNRHVAEIVDRGVNYFDVAPTYGNAQELLGAALQPYRDRCVLACKTTERSAAGSRAEMEESLRLLRTDHFDLYQLHGLADVSAAEAAMGPGGAIETLLDAKRRGDTRLIGFSAHSEAAALLAIESGQFDTMMIPLNFFLYEGGTLGPRALETARRRGMGIIALKALARGRMAKGQPKPYAKCWYQPEDDPPVADLLLRWTLSLPGVTAALPPGNEDLFEMAVELGERFAPIDEAELAQLRSLRGAYEPLFAVE